MRNYNLITAFMLITSHRGNTLSDKTMSNKIFLTLTNFVTFVQ